MGIALAALMVLSGVLATIVNLQATLRVRPDVARASAALSFSGVALFTGFITLGIATSSAPTGTSGG